MCLGGVFDFRRNGHFLGQITMAIHTMGTGKTTDFMAKGK